MTTDTHKEYMLTLGVFDDGDVCPTLIVGFLVPYDTCTDEQMAESLTIYADEMREAAAVQYGRPFPQHAEFWFCETREVPNDELRDEVQRDSQDTGGAAEAHPGVAG